MLLNNSKNNCIYLHNVSYLKHISYFIFHIDGKHQQDLKLSFNEFSYFHPILPQLLFAKISVVSKI